jgi:uncharacterized membrane protein
VLNVISKSINFIYCDTFISTYISYFDINTLFYCFCLLMISMYSNKWQRAAPLNSSRQQLGVGVINGSLFAVGGSDGYSRLNSVERYDRELDRWIYTKSLNTSRSGVGVGILGDALYALGGYDGRTCLKTVERYDPQVDCWSCVASLNVTRSFPGVFNILM